MQIALALADAFGCGVNDLPLTLVLSWYEQKAVCILLTLLALGIKRIYLGPTLPAFLSETVVKTLVDTYQLQPITHPQQDLDAILHRGQRNIPRRGRGMFLYPSTSARPTNTGMVNAEIAV